jgi:hypothetical protein
MIKIDVVEYLGSLADEFLRYFRDLDDNDCKNVEVFSLATFMWRNYPQTMQDEFLDAWNYLFDKDAFGEKILTEFLVAMGQYPNIFKMSMLLVRIHLIYHVILNRNNAIDSRQEMNSLLHYSQTQ